MPQDETPSDVLHRALRIARTALGKIPDYGRYLECVAQASQSACALKYEHVFATLYWRTFARYCSDEPDERTIEPVPLAHVESLEAVLTNSTEPAERLSALLLLQCRGGGDVYSYPERAYTNLHERPAIEVVQLLENYERAPATSQDVAAAISSLRRDARILSDAPLAAAVVASLGRPEHAAELLVVLDELPLEQRRAIASTSLPRALAGCGYACLDRLLTYADSDNAGDRFVAYHAVPYLDGPLRQRVVDRIVSRDQRGTTAAEIAARSRFLDTPTTR